MNKSTIWRLGSLAILFTCAQLSWAINDGVYTITSKYSGKLVEVGSADTADGANVNQWPANGSATQQWVISNVGGDDYSVINLNSGKAMEVYDFSTADGGNVAQWEYWGGESQTWTIMDEGDGYFSFVNKLSGKALDLLDWDTSDGANIAQWEYWGGDTQLWSLNLVQGNNNPTSVTIQEDAGFCSVDGSVDTNHSGYNGSGFANTDNNAGAGVDWQVNVLQGGTYTFQWRFANGGSSARPADVLVDNQAQYYGLSQPTTGAWSSWADSETVELYLSQGSHSIRLRATASAGLGNIDSLTISGNGALSVSNCGGGDDDVFKPDYILGAAITWTLEHESIGRRYSDEGQTKSIERILVDHGFNFIRIRQFVCPECAGGYLDNLYSGAGPTEHWGDTAHTIELAKRTKACGMGVFLDIMLSDNWASIGKQSRPSQWAGLSDSQRHQASYNHAKDVLNQMVAAGVKPDMVQCGNENNTHVAGYSYNDWYNFSGVINSCVRAVRELDPKIPVVAHHGRPRPDGDFPFWVDRAFGSNPAWDADIVCGSTYGTTNNGGDWWDMFNYVINTTGKRVMSCEYTDGRRDLVNDTFINLPNGMGVGSFIWEPAGYGDKRPFDYSNGVYYTNSSMNEYARIAREAGIPVPSTPASQLQGTSCQ